MRYLISLLISYAIGNLFLNIIFKKEHRLNNYLHFFLALGTGIAFSTQILFYGFVVFNQLNKPAMILAHFIFLLILFFVHFHLNFKKINRWLADKGLFRMQWDIPINLYLVLITLMFLATIAQAYFYPMGGWDAWSAWNLKARFLFLGKTHWRNLLDPILWRSSPHYPLLLPLTDVWSWIFGENPEPAGPLVVSLVFSFMTAGLVFAGLIPKALQKNPRMTTDTDTPQKSKENKSQITTSKTKEFLLRFHFSLDPSAFWACLATLLMICLPFFTKLASSQYCDIVLAYYLLGTLMCLILARSTGVKSSAFMAGLFLGFLSFTKTEGMSAAVIIFIFSLPYLFLRKKPVGQQVLIIFFLIGLGLGVLPTVIFQKFYSPGNQTFINGLTSTVKPANLFRLKMILSFFLVELVSVKWNGLWLILLIGIILTKGNAFHSLVRIVPVFLFSYLLMIGAYYYLNTYFDIGWWLKVSLNRILFGILPTAVFWVFYSIGKEEKDEGPP